VVGDGGLEPPTSCV